MTDLPAGGELARPVVGQILYDLNVGNRHRRGVEQKLTPVRVTSVGRKYFTCCAEGSQLETKYHLDSWREATDYCVDHELYTSPQEWEDETRRLAIAFRFNHTNWKAFSLETLRKIQDLLPSIPTPIPGGG
jgi:hypothetical protein